MIRTRSIGLFFSVFLFFLTCSSGEQDITFTSVNQESNQQNQETTHNENESEEENNYSQDIFVPGQLLIYYGYPSLINNSAGELEQAGTHFAKYDYVVLGDGLEEENHSDHSKTKTIINHESCREVDFFGYIDLAAFTGWDKVIDLEKKMSSWEEMGVTGFFLDDFGYDFGVSRVTQNGAVEYAHFLNLKVIVNAWDPDDVFGSETDVIYNPAKLSHCLDSSDFYLAESFQIKVGEYSSELEWQEKMTKLLDYQEESSFKLLAVTTNDSSNNYDQAKFYYAWYSAFLYDFTAIGWGEYHFGSSESLAPYRAVPEINFGLKFTSEIQKDGSLYWRKTDRGRLQIDVEQHTSNFLLNSKKN